MIGIFPENVFKSFMPLLHFCLGNLQTLSLRRRLPTLAQVQWKSRQLYWGLAQVTYWKQLLKVFLGAWNHSSWQWEASMWQVCDTLIGLHLKSYLTHITLAWGWHSFPIYTGKNRDSERLICIRRVLQPGIHNPESSWPGSKPISLNAILQVAHGVLQARASPEVHSLQTSAPSLGTIFPLLCQSIKSKRVHLSCSAVLTLTLMLPLQAW